MILADPLRRQPHELGAVIIATGFTAGVPWYRMAPGADTANVKEQTSVDTSLLSRYRDFIHLRQQTPALAVGDLQFVTVDGAQWRALGYLRTEADQRVLVVHNLGDKPATLSWSVDGEPDYGILWGDRGVGLPAMNAITMPAHATGVWELR